MKTSPLLDRIVCLVRAFEGSQGRAPPRRVRAPALPPARLRHARDRAPARARGRLARLRLGGRQAARRPARLAAARAQVRRRRRQPPRRARRPVPLAGARPARHRQDAGRHQRRHPPSAGVRRLPALQGHRGDGGHAARHHRPRPEQAAARLRAARRLPAALRPVGGRRLGRRAGDPRGGDRLRLPRPAEARPASTSPRCPIGTGPNPRVEQGVSFTVHDFAGTPTADTDIETMGSAFTGLDVGFRTEIVLPVPCTAVEATLVTFARPPRSRRSRPAAARRAR